MALNDNNISKPSPNRENEFVDFEKRMSDIYQDSSEKDRSLHADENGYYTGEYEPEKLYFISIRAFIDERELDIFVPALLSAEDHEFIGDFKSFRYDIKYLVQRFSLRGKNVDSTTGSVIAINSEYKSEIDDLLGTIRKIVRLEVKDINKRDKIFSKIALLQSEIDREQTTVDALFGCMIDLSQTIGECAEKIEPLINKLERIKKIFWDKSNKVKLLPTKDRTKLISHEDMNSDLDDEIPF